MRDAIDHYKDAAEKGGFQVKIDTEGYPPDLDTLVNGVDVQGKKVKFLRRVPVDPMTGKAEWGLRSMQVIQKAIRGVGKTSSTFTPNRNYGYRRNEVFRMVRRLGLIFRSRLKRRGQLDSTGRAENVSGFTLVELMIVMLIIGVLMAIAVPNYLSSLKGAKEAVLKEDLHVLRQAIDAYTVDKEKAPQSLDDLVQAGYLKALPVDPMTRSNTTWVADTSDSLHSLDQTEPGIDDVHRDRRKHPVLGTLQHLVMSR